MFKSVERKLTEIGFKITYKSELVVIFERYNKEFKYVHCVEIIRKTKRVPIIQSYEKDRDTMVGLTIKEIKLFLKFIKSLKW